MIFVLRNEVDECLKRIAQHKLADIGGTFQECYDETLADYHNGAISDAFIDFMLKNPDAQLVLSYGEGGDGGGR